MKTDTQLQLDVLEELTWDPSVDAAQIGVEVRDGVVTLAGTVGSFAEKWEAERAVQRVSGVRALAVELSVRLPGASVRSDADIARTVENVLSWMSNVTDGSIKVMVEGGWVTLSGSVEWDYQRKAATAAVRYLMGVTGVSDSIGILQQVSASAVQDAIEAALKRGALADARHIFVEVSGNKVTLSGTVRNWSERELAQHAAWGTHGVSMVIDNITLAI
ncbi:BON domain-containing protein [Janthinobacterium psychrotolerans]|uniref:Osmotically-inducible protein OsmY n=1 Tax=Janthinobacterium psychrotolerans TaxID=1747903 RepID=A0A1A7C5P9_9BURK|nr:BON domain-containing protein [Janthinobacterium psychrotolerans]OBV41246.1 Osmotically-inducible protein OsmY [Janthinobacterium psychrotolerans]